MWGHIKSSHRWQRNRKHVFFHLHDSRLQPYYYALIFHFHVRNYNILFCHDLKFIAGCVKTGKYIFELKSLKIGFTPKEKKTFIFITDKESKKLNENWKQTVLIDSNIFYPKKLDNYIQTPFPLNPEFYHSDLYKTTEALRSRSRTIKAFFSGNQESTAYNHSIFRDFFHVLSRNTLLNALCEKLPNDKLLVVGREKSSIFNENGYVNKFVLIKWSWMSQKSTNLKSRIGNQNWFSTLAKSDFFVAAPGIRMPMCFNVIEAMSVGCIPIIEYAHHFCPKLEHLKNCIAFSGKDDLITKMNMVFEMEKVQINELRRNVIEYYDKYLAPGKLCDMLEIHKDKSLKLYLYATEVSYQEYLKSTSKNEK